MKGFLTYFIIASCVLLAVYLDYHVYTAAIMVLAYCVSIFLNRDNTNIVHLCSLLLLFKLTEQVLFLFIPLTAGEGQQQVWVNNTIYLTHLALDISLLVLLCYRGALSRYIYGKLNKSTEGLHLTYADIALWGVLVCFIFVDAYSLGENLVRNLEHMGVDEETAKQFWDVNWMFYHYPDIKRWLMGAEFLAIWAMISKMAKREFTSLPA